MSVFDHMLLSKMNANFPGSCLYLHPKSGWYCAVEDSDSGGGKVVFLNIDKKNRYEVSEEDLSKDFIFVLDLRVKDE